MKLCLLDAIARVQHEEFLLLHVVQVGILLGDIALDINVGHDDALF